MIKDITSVKIGSLWNEGRGATFKETIDCTPVLSPDIVFETPLTADLMLIRMKDSIVAILENIETGLTLNCTKCLENFTQKITILTSEREFLENKPDHDYDPMEVFLINRQEMCLDLTEMLRQEIILHFPMIPVCSKRCRGLCPGCGVNLNKHQVHQPGCTGEIVATEQYKPLSHLKNLFKSQEQ